jgi:ribosome-interacting GTPase 1
MREDDVAEVQSNVITKNEKAGVQLGNLMRIAATGRESMRSYLREFKVIGCVIAR